MGVHVELRRVQPADLPLFYGFLCDPVAVRMAAFTPENPTDRAAHDAKWAQMLADDTVLVRTILADARPVGHIASWLLDGRRNVCYWIDRAAWGRGIASRALALYLELDPRRPLHASAAADNAASLRVLRTCGFLDVGSVQAHANARGEMITETLMELR